MSKVIKITPELLAEIRAEFEESLKAGKFADGKINFTKTMGTVARKATVFFSEIAWLKMWTLVSEFDKEVAWHGVAKRGEDPTKDEYYITDILVYPQEVTGATVNTDQVKYQTWLMSHDDDVFNNIRMQGHSHVNMGVTPSTVDTTHQEQILDQLEGDMFYIFMIWNKRKDKTIKIYDLAKNVLFETADVTVEIMNDGTGIESWLKQAKEMVVTKTYTYQNGGCNGYGGGYNGYNDNYYNGGYRTPSAQETQTAAPASGNTPPKNNSLSVVNGTNKSSDKKNGKRKGKRKGKKAPTNACDTKGYTQLEFPLSDDDDGFWPTT